METNAIHRKEGIISAAIDVINEYGLQALSTREVARRQGISEGTVFKYFPKKNDLISAVVDQYSRFDDDLINSARLKNLDPFESILYSIENSTVYYENYPAITAIMHAYDTMLCDPVLAEKVKEIYYKRKRFITAMFEEAKKLNHIKAPADCPMLADIVTGACRDICLKWRIEKFCFSLRDETVGTLRFLFDIFRN